MNGSITNGMLRLVIGGSPCTHWSIAQSPDKRETTAEGLGWDLFLNYKTVIEKYKPDYFLYENNKSMAPAIRAQITAEFGLEPVLINSALVSAQNRQRLYWVGKREPDGTYSQVHIPQPADRGILLRDVLETTAEAVCVAERGRYNENGKAEQQYEPRTDGKTNALTTVQKDNQIAVPVKVGDMPNQQGEINGGQFARIYSQDGKTPALMARPNGGGVDGPRFAIPAAGRIVGRKINEDGHRDDYNPDIETVQRFEVNENPEKTNCITTVTKDNMIAEPLNFQNCPDYSSCEYAHACQHCNYCVASEKTTPTTTDKDNTITEPVRVGCMPSPNGELKNSQGMRIYSIEGKSVNMTAGGGGLGGKSGPYAIPVPESKIAPINDMDGGKCRTLTANYHKSSARDAVVDCAGGRTMVCEDVENFIVREATKQGYTEIAPGECVDLTQPNSKTRRGRKMAEKSNCVMTGNQYYQYCGTVDKPIYEVKDGMITIKDRQYPIKLVDGFYIIRKLTVLECKRLQTVPDDYIFPISDSQAYKCLGNGWTVDVIAHLMSHFVGITEKPVEVMSMYDGMSCGHIALDKLGANITTYYATEIDKYAIQATMANYPDTIQLGDAFAVRDEAWHLPGQELPPMVETATTEAEGDDTTNLDDIPEDMKRQITANHEALLERDAKAPPAPQRGWENSTSRKLLPTITETTRKGLEAATIAMAEQASENKKEQPEMNRLDRNGELVGLNPSELATVLQTLSPVVLSVRDCNGDELTITDMTVRVRPNGVHLLLDVPEAYRCED